jgi:hypothetical protein
MEKFLALYGAKKYILCPYKPATGHYPKLIESNTHPLTLFIYSTFTDKVDSNWHFLAGIA